MPEGGCLAAGMEVASDLEDSPTCSKGGCSASTDTDCVLMSFVPKECRDDTVPCRHIPLTEIGKTLDSLYRTGTSEEIEQTLEIWLRKIIGQLEWVKSGRSRFRKAKLRRLRWAVQRKRVGNGGKECRTLSPRIVL